MKQSGLNYLLLCIEYKKKNRIDANRPDPAATVPSCLQDKNCSKIGVNQFDHVVNNCLFR